MNNERNLFILAGLFAGFCIALSFAVWWSVNELAGYREEYDLLDAEQHNYTGMINELRAQNMNLSRINQLSINKAGTASDAVEFYSLVRQAIENNNVNMISMSSANQGGAENVKDTSSIINLKLQGSYYAIARLFASWRTMPAASRITQLRLHTDTANPVEFIEAEVTIEAMLGDNE